MPNNNILLFDQNKSNVMSDQNYSASIQRLNGVQRGIASSQLQNKVLYQTSLIAYALAQLMNANGLDASDADQVSTFVSNMSLSIMQKVLDKATSAEAKAGVAAGKWVSPAAMKAACLFLSGGTMTGDIAMGNNRITGLPTPTNVSDAATKQYVDDMVNIKAHGTYVGTGTYGASTPNVLNFPFAPQLLIIHQYGEIVDLGAYGGTNISIAIMLRGAGGSYRYRNLNESNGIKIVWSGNSVSWYAYNFGSSSASASAQFNSSGVTYSYFAIG